MQICPIILCPANKILTLTPPHFDLPRLFSLYSDKESEEV